MLALVAHQGFVGRKPEVALPVLDNPALDIVVGEGVGVALAVFVHLYLLAVVAVQPVDGTYPNEAPRIGENDVVVGLGEAVGLGQVVEKKPFRLGDASLKGEAQEEPQKNWEV